MAIANPPESVNTWQLWKINISTTDDLVNGANVLGMLHTGFLIHFSEGSTTRHPHSSN